MSTYTIGEVADRSGFSASALRYYEGIGLVQPASRTEAGYRMYDDHALARLAFIARAKQLGCSLDEITDLVSVWDGERCEPVQQRFHELVTAKIVEAQRQAAELVAFTAQLQTAAAQLGAPSGGGPCDAACGCMGIEPEIACTLVAEAMPDRMAEWQAVLGMITSREPLDGGVRVTFGDGISVAELADLMAAEQQCCAFFAFTLTVDHRGVALEVRAPEGAADIVHGLFGTAA